MTIQSLQQQQQQQQQQQRRWRESADYLRASFQAVRSVAQEIELLCVDKCTEKNRNYPLRRRYCP
jgi:hypothetical protein